MNRYLKIILIIITCFIVIVIIRNSISPPNWIDLRLVHVPTDVDTIYVVAHDRQGNSPLNWYVAKVFASVVSPRQVGESWYLWPRGDQRRGDVQWRAADSYGILAHRKSGEWVVWWLAPDNVERPPLLRYLTGGGTRVLISASGIETAAPAPPSLTERVKEGAKQGQRWTRNGDAAEWH